MAETVTAGTGSDDDSDQLMSIHEAARSCNVRQLRRALAAGASPNDKSHHGQPPFLGLCYLRPRNAHKARMACLDLLRQSPGFDVNATDRVGSIAVHYLATHAKSRDDVEFMQAVVDAGADVNATTGLNKSTALHSSIADTHYPPASGSVCAAKIGMLIRAGASVTARDRDGETPLDCAISTVDISSPYPDFAISERKRMRRVYPLLLAAGAALPSDPYFQREQDSIDPYLQRVKAAGSFANYERQHLNKLTTMLTPRRGPSSPLRRVPPEVLRRIVAFAFHVGYY